MSKENSKLSYLTNGIIKENPVLRLVLGTCPTLAVTTAAFNGLGMGLAATFVLICSNIAISALRKVIPDKVRLPAYITVIATFVTIVQMLVQAYVQDLYSALGVYLPLIVVNCIIPEQIDRISIMTTPPGGFLTFGMLMALVIFLETKMGQKKKRAIGCEGCPSAANCQSKGACN